MPLDASVLLTLADMVVGILCSYVYGTALDVVTRALGGKTSQGADKC
jgi:hypothetical protein